MIRKTKPSSKCWIWPQTNSGAINWAFTASKSWVRHSVWFSWLAGSAKHESVSWPWRARRSI